MPSLGYREADGTLPAHLKRRMANMGNGIQRDRFAKKTDAERRCEEQRMLPNVESCNVLPDGSSWIAETRYRLRLQPTPPAGKDG